MSRYIEADFKSLGMMAFSGFGESTPATTGMTGDELWNATLQARNSLEVSFQMILLRAQLGPVPCDTITQYNAAVTALLQLERDALAEMKAKGLEIGVSEPRTLPSIEGCQAGETELNLAVSKSAINGAIAGHRARVKLWNDALKRNQSPNLGVAPVVIGVGVVIVAGVVVAQLYAATKIVQFIFGSVYRSRVAEVDSLTKTVNALARAGVDPKTIASLVTNMQKQLPDANRWNSWGTMSKVFLGVGAGIALSVGAWYFFSRTDRGRRVRGAATGRLSGASHRRAYIVE